MTAHDRRYSRFVARAKILLPIFALAVLSTVFMFSRHFDPAENIPFSKADVDKLAREQRIGQPEYSGVTADGTAVSISAGEARPELSGPRQLIAEQLAARIETSDGLRLDITARTGRVDQDAGVARLEGGVEILSSNGYRLRTKAVTANLEKTGIRTDNRVTGEGPLGRFEAGRMILTGDETGRMSHVLVFKNGVKLIYDPEQ